MKRAHHAHAIFDARMAVLPNLAGIDSLAELMSGDTVPVEQRQVAKP
jgi:hypothetical protein